MATSGVPIPFIRLSMMIMMMTKNGEDDDDDNGDQNDIQKRQKAGCPHRKRVVDYQSNTKVCSSIH